MARNTPRPNWLGLPDPWRLTKQSWPLWNCSPSRKIRRSNKCGWPRGGKRKQSTPAPIPAKPPLITKAAAKIPTPIVQIGQGISALTQQILQPVRQLLFPASLDAHSERMALIIRDLNGQHAILIQRADEQMAKWRNEFDKTPVPRGWKYDPAAPLPPNYAFIQSIETGNVASLSPELQQLAKIMRDQLDGLISRVQALDPECLQSLIENYFPHVWKDPKAASRISRMAPSSRPLEGPKGFLKKRTLEYFTDGLLSGLEPISDNPVEIHLFKVAEMSKFLMAQRMLVQAKASGLRKFCGIFKRIPDGWEKVEDPTTKVFAPPFVSVKEAYDVQLRDGMLNLIKQMGWGYERTITNLKAKGFTQDTFGFWNPNTKEIKVKNFTGDLTIAHEIGHGLDQHYGLSDYFYKAIPDHALQEKELAALSTARDPDTNKMLFGKVNAKLSQEYHDYIHSRSERMAEVVAAYLYTPDLLRSLAPTIYTAYDHFLMLHPELHEFRDLRPSLQRGAEEVQVPVHGQIQIGNWIMPSGAANVLHNYLSPGLSRHGLYRSMRAVSNLLNSATLGLSAFHLGFTSCDAIVSQVAVGLFQALHGNLKAVPTLLTAPAAPMTNYMRGLRLQRAMLDPRKADPAMRILAQMAVRGGMRATIDPFYKTAFTKNFRRAIAGMKMNLQSGRIPMTEGVHVILNLLPMLIEQGMRPIAEYVVPRQKLGVFAQLAELEISRLGPDATLEDVRRAMAMAADTTEDRMGQLTYDNLFHNKIAKDLLMLAFRAYGWQFGKYRAMGKMAGEAVGAVNSMAHLRKPKISTNLTYGVALTMTIGLLGGILMKMLSGKNPETLNDLMMPQTGKLDSNGHPQRLMLPSYAKDMISDWHDFPNLKKFGTSFSHKLNPALSMLSDMYNNKDFYGTEIRHDDDSAWQQSLQVCKFLGKSFLPFSVTGTMKLHESGASIAEQTLPFIGIVPAKASLSMTPAEAKAEELYVDSLPQGSRTQDQADHSALLSKIKASIRMGNGTAAGLMADNIATLKTTDLPNILKESGKPAILLHVEKLNLDQGMSVFDLSNDLEKSQLAPMLLRKLGQAVGHHGIPSDRAVTYAKVLSAPPSR